MPGHSLHAFSYGGGTQSTAALVLATEARLDYRLFVFANVGEDSENPETLAYVRDFVRPFVALHPRIELVEVRKEKRGGELQTLLGRIEAHERSIPIPVRMGPAGAPASRTCTAEFKIRVIERELRRRGATKENRAMVGIGISTDEPGRIGSEIDPRSGYQLRRYPLIDLGLSRADCQQIVRNAGLPVPPRSACWFCPFHSAEEWRQQARRRPDLFEKSCALEELIHARGERLGRGEFYFTRYGARLRDLFRGDELPLFEDEDPNGLEPGCASGHCMT
jgi:3'-phosphoadenosine 5'-phosphosulfate sulfotransferase (PAPS reductase)/FAD synthetase